MFKNINIAFTLSNKKMTCTNQTKNIFQNTEDYYVHQFNTGCLAQFSYYIESNKEAIIIDPIRESDIYIDLLKVRGAKLKYILETHFHADFVSGHCELAKLTGAEIVFGPSAKPQYDSIVANDGDLLNLGDVKIQVFHSPGHTLESSSFTLLDRTHTPKAIFTGDFLFLGEVGRPDLAVSNEISERDLAGMLFDSITKLKKTLPDDVVIFPGHGAGSACGKNISSGVSDTLGNQKKTNYALNDNLKKEEFIEIVTSNLPTPPKYFFFDAMMNKKGYDTTETILEKSYRAINPKDFIELAKEKDIAVLDTRDFNKSMSGFFKESYLISLKITYAITTANMFPPNQKFLFITDPGQERESILRLARVGYENSVGFVEVGYEGLEKYCVSQGLVDKISFIRTVQNDNLKTFVEEIIEKQNMEIVDVREKSEWESTGVVPNAKLVSLGNIEGRIDEFIEIGENKPLVVYCRSGGRAAVAGSILKKYNIPQVYSIGGILNMITHNVPIKKLK